MKRMIALLLTTILLISCLPLTVNAAKEPASVEQKFKLLLSDIELEPDLNGKIPEKYYYQELAHYPEKNPDWVLFQGGMDYKSVFSSERCFATLGNKLVSLSKTGAPFKLTYGVYDAKTGAFYDILDAWDMDFENLRDTWDALPPTNPKGQGIETVSDWAKTFLIGDADSDASLSILDATRIQRGLAELIDLDDGTSYLPSSEHPLLRGVYIKGVPDYDRDGDWSIMDATKLQRYIAELPNNIDHKLAWDERYFPRGSQEPRNILINSLDELNLKDTRLATDEDKIDDPEKKIRDAYDDEFFKENSLLILDVSLEYGNYKLTLKNLSIDHDGTLNVDFNRFEPLSVTDGINDRFICIELSKAFVDDIRDIKVNYTSVRAKNYSYGMLWDERDYDYEGMELRSEIITSADQLDPGNSYHKKLINELGNYMEDAFRGNAYVLARVPLGTTSLSLGVADSPTLNSDGVLKIYIVAYGPNVGNAVENNRFVCIEIGRGWIEDSKEQKVELMFDYDNVEDNFDYRLAKHPYIKVDDPSDKDSEVTLFTDRDQLDPQLRGHQTLLNDYDEAFFKNHGLLAVHTTLPYYAVVQMMDLSVDREPGMNTRRTVLNVRMRRDLSSDTEPWQTEVYFVLEVNAYYRIAGDSVAVKWFDMGPYDLIDSAADMKNPVILPEQPEEERYQYVVFDEDYSANLNNVGAQSYLLNQYRSEGRTASDAGVVAVINDPITMRKVIDDSHIDNGYTDEGFVYEPGRTYAYDLDFFRDYSLVAIAHHAEWYSNTLNINELYKKNGTLYVSASFTEPSTDNTPREADYLTFVKVMKSDIADCTAVKLGIPDSKGQIDVDRLYDEIALYNHGVEIPEKPEEEGYKYVNGSDLNIKTTSSFDWEASGLQRSDTGYVMLIKNREDFMRYFPGYNADSLAFGQNAIVAAIVQGNDYSSKAYISGMAMKDNTLYIHAGFTNSYSYDENGNPIALPKAPILQVFKLIPQSAVKDVTNVRYWSTASPPYGKNISFSVDENHLPIDVSELSKTGEGYMITSAGQTAGTIQKLYTDESGNSVPRDAHTFKAESYTKNYYASKSLIALRVYQGGSNTEVTVDRIYRSSPTELTVELSRKFDSDEPPTPDENWRIIFVSIPNYEKEFSVKVSVLKDPPLAARVQYKNTPYTMPTASSELREYRSISSTRAFRGAYDFVESKAYKDICGGNVVIDGGYIAVIRNVNQFNYIFPDDVDDVKDVRAKYGDAYFEKNALVVLVHPLTDFTEDITLSHLAVRDGTLYGAMNIAEPRITPPTFNLYFDAQEVKKSDLSDVKNLALWSIPQNERSCFYRNYDAAKNIPATPDDFAEQGYTPVAMNRIKVNSQDSYVNAIKGYEDVFAVVSFNRDQFIELNGSEIADDYSERYFDNYAFVTVAVNEKYRDDTSDIVRVSVKDNNLAVQVKFDAYDENSGDPVPAEKKHTTVAIYAVLKKDIPDANTIEVFRWKTPKLTATSFNYYEDELKQIPENLWVNRFTTVDATRSFRGSIDYYNRAYDTFNSICGEKDSYEQIGYIALVRSTDELLYLLPEYAGYDADRAIYNDAFFEKYAFVVLAYRLDNFDDSVWLSHLAVRDNVLYGEMTIKSHMTVHPLYNITYDVLRVNKSDVEGVTETAVWQNPSNEKHYVYCDSDGIDKIPQTPENIDGYTVLNTEKQGVYTEKEFYNEIDRIFGSRTYAALTFNEQQYEMACGKKLSNADFDKYAYLTFVCYLEHEGDTAGISHLYVNGNTAAAEIWIDAYQPDSGEPEPAKDLHYTISVCRILKSDIPDMLTLNRMELWRDDIKYDYVVNDDGDVEITRYLGNDANVVVPTAIDGKKVVAIGDEAFAAVGRTLKSVIVPDTVTSLGDRVFYRCWNLKTINLPDSIISMGKEMFYACTALTDAVLPKYLDSVPESVFYGCRVLTSVGLPDRPTAIGDNAFRGCNALENITIPDTVKTIGNYGFTGCGFETFSLPDSVTSIGGNSFSGCSYLQTISLPEGLTSVGSSAFDRCSALKDVRLSDNVTYIGSGAFYACRAIERFTVPSGVTAVNSSTFAYCTALTDIDLPSTLSAIGANAFEKCTSLKTLTIPYSVQTLGESMAFNCTALEQVAVAADPVSVETLSLRLTTVGSEAFRGCSALRSVDLPDTVKSIGSRAFFDCASLTEFDLPSAVTLIRGDTFNGCTALRSVTMNGDPLTVNTVSGYAFRSCSALTTIAFADTLTEIGDAAFRGCSSLSSVKLEENLKTIGTDAFLECTSLKELMIPRSVTTIPRYALGYTVDEKNYYVKRNDFTIRGYSGTRAETYANNYSFPFVKIDGE